MASDIVGVSGREMMAALIGGQTNPTALARLARGRMRATLGALEEAFTGRFTDHHRLLLTTMLARVDALDADIAEFDTVIGEMIASVAAAVERLDEIPGAGTTAARVIIAEVGSAAAPAGRVRPAAHRSPRAHHRRGGARRHAHLR
ncbi:MAG: hypothetical protein ACRDRE_16395 [Pseudonocardiaceae bacterium]